MTAILDHIIIAAPSLAVAAPWERLGLVLSEPAGHAGLGTENRALMVGDSPEAQFYVEFLAVRDRAEAEESGARGSLLAALDTGRAAYRLMLAVEDLSPYGARLGGAARTPYEVVRDGGDKICDVLPVVAPEAGCDIGLVRYTRTREEMFEGRRARGLFNHAFPLKRLDHLAVIVPDIVVSTRWWTDALGVPLHGTVTGRGMLINQLKMGDGVLELIGPDSPESPVASRPPGLISMAAFEVLDLNNAVGLARERGFSLPEGAPGVLPGTRTSMTSPDQFGGLGLQLLEYRA